MTGKILLLIVAVLAVATTCAFADGSAKGRKVSSIFDDDHFQILKGATILQSPIHKSHHLLHGGSDDEEERDALNNYILHHTMNSRMYRDKHGIHLEMELPGYDHIQVLILAKQYLDITGQNLQDRWRDVLHQEGVTTDELEQRKSRNHVDIYDNIRTPWTIKGQYLIPDEYDCSQMDHRLEDGILYVTIPRRQENEIDQTKRPTKLTWPPKVTTTTEGENFVAKIHLPSVQKEHLRIDVERGHAHIFINKKIPAINTSGDFVFSINVPPHATNRDVHAQLKYDYLTLTIPLKPTVRHVAVE